MQGALQLSGILEGLFHELRSVLAAGPALGGTALQARMREPGLKQRINAPALDGMSTPRVAYFLATSHLTDESVEQQTARSGLKAQALRGPP